MPLSHIEDWIFDLDNTLYPAECNLFAQIDVRMGEFISIFLDVDPREARRIQKHYFKEYGTTLNGLMKLHDLHPKKFLDYVHDIDHSPVSRNALLDKALGEMKGQKFIFTNGTIEHAENVMKQLGVDHHFEDIFDIVVTNYIPKPKKQGYLHVMDKTGIDPAKTAMFEDLARNLLVPHELGMSTVLVQTMGTHPDEGLGVLGSGEEEHVHHVTTDLTEFLEVTVNKRQTSETG